MISPDEIETKAFVVSLRGYDRVEVDRWLQEVADEHRKLMTDLEAASQPPSANPADTFDVIGREVAEVLRAAREAAAAMFERALEDIDRAKRAAMADVAAAHEARERAIERVRSALVDELLRNQDAQ